MQLVDQTTKDTQAAALSEAMKRMDKQREAVRVAGIEASIALAGLGEHSEARGYVESPEIVRCRDSANYAVRMAKAASANGVHDDQRAEFMHRARQDATDAMELAAKAIAVQPLDALVARAHATRAATAYQHALVIVAAKEV